MREEHVTGQTPDLDTLWRPFTQHAQRQQPLVITEAAGCKVRDAQGNEYLDAMAGLWCVNVGYGQERLVRAAAEQMRRLSYTNLLRPSPPALEVAKRVTSLLPGDLNHIQFLNSGSEAVETALKIARQYGRQAFPKQNRHKIIGRYRGYHGWTLGALSATGQYARKVQFEPLPAGFLHVRPPDTFRLFAGMSPAEAARSLAQELEEIIEFEGPETVAAFIGEPIIGGGGVIVPPDEYWPLIRQVCDKYGILLILDEVITGFGRTGTWFGAQNWDIVADITTMAKALTSGYVPMAATAVNDKVFAAFLGEPAENRHFAQISTFGGHPVAAAVALENIALIEELGLLNNALQMGERLGAGLRALRERHGIVGDVRGKGLIWGVELVRPGTLEPLPAAQVNQVLGEAQRRGLLLGKNTATVPRLECVLTIAPPLIIAADEVDRLVDVLDGALATVQA
mgnify:CR=1 FL=1